MKREPAAGEKFRILFFGILIPVTLLYMAYTQFMGKYYFSMFGRDGIRSTYSERFLSGFAGATLPPIEIVVLGDSTAKSAVTPRDITAGFTVNLGINGGTALTAYHYLANFMDRYSAPKCAVLILQYNWKRNYDLFFSRVLFYRTFDFQAVRRIWGLGEENHVFPADTYGKWPFYLKSLRALWRLDQLPLTQMQAAVGLGPQTELYRVAMKRSMFDRGALHMIPETVLPDDRFFTEAQDGAYLRDFVPSVSEDFYLHLLEQLAREKKTHLLVVQTPFSKRLSSAATDRFAERRNDYVRKLFEGSGVTVIPVNSLPDNMYHDFDHLNADGARAVADQLDPILKEFCH